MGFGPRYPISESVLNQRAVATRKWHISSDKIGIYHLPEIPEVFSEEWPLASLALAKPRSIFTGFVRKIGDKHDITWFCGRDTVD